MAGSYSSWPSFLDTEENPSNHTISGVLDHFNTLPVACHGTSLWISGAFSISLSVLTWGRFLEVPAKSTSSAKSSVFSKFNSLETMKYRSSKTVSSLSGLTLPTDAAQKGTLRSVGWAASQPRPGCPFLSRLLSPHIGVNDFKHTSFVLVLRRHGPGPADTECPHVFVPGSGPLYKLMRGHAAGALANALPYHTHGTWAFKS